MPGGFRYNQGGEKRKLPRTIKKRRRKIISPSGDLSAGTRREGENLSCLNPLMLREEGKLNRIIKPK